MNFQIKQFHSELINLINKCGLPIGVAYFVLRDCLGQLENGYNIAVQNESENTVYTETEDVPLDIKGEEDEETNEAR